MSEMNQFIAECRQFDSESSSLISESNQFVRDISQFDSRCSWLPKKMSRLHSGHNWFIATYN